MLRSSSFAVLAAALSLGAATASRAGEVMATAPADTGGSSAVSAPAPAASAPTASAAPAATPSATSSMTAEQIDQWIRAAPPPSVKDDGANGVTSGKEKREMHGVVSASVGTGGYSNVTMATSIPLGETGLLSVGVSQTKGGRYGGYGYGRGYGYGGGYGGFSPGPGYGFGGPGYGYGGERQSFSLGLALGENAGGSRSRPTCDAPDRNAANTVRIDRPEDGLSAYDPVGCAYPRGRD
jgi:hypothetical protein